MAESYEEGGGVACLSVLKDEKYFQGGLDYLLDIRKFGVKCPLLVRDVIVDASQIYHARTKGADAILLMASILTDQDIGEMIKICKTLRMAALVEVYDEKEMDRVLRIEGIELIKIHHETFEAADDSTKKLFEGRRGKLIHDNNILVVGHNVGLNGAAIKFAEQAGVKAVLYGEPLQKE